MVLHLLGTYYFVRVSSICNDAHKFACKFNSSIFRSFTANDRYGRMHVCIHIPYEYNIDPLNSFQLQTLKIDVNHFFGAQKSFLLQKLFHLLILYSITGWQSLWSIHIESATSTINFLVDNGYSLDFRVSVKWRKFDRDTWWNSIREDSHRREHYYYPRQRQCTFSWLNRNCYLASYKTLPLSHFVYSQMVLTFFFVPGKLWKSHMYTITWTTEIQEEGGKSIWILSRPPAQGSLFVSKSFCLLFHR